MISLEDVIPHYTHDNFFFIQIGANNGRSGDPILKFINRYNWSGIFVEPISKCIRSLKKLHRGKDQFIFEQSAITEQDGPVDFYEAKRNSQLSSLSITATQNIMKRRTEKKGIQKRTVNGMTLSSLVQKYSVKKIDLLQVDVEGFDDMVVKQVHTLSQLPKLINFEFKHLSESKKINIINFLRGIEYRIITRSSKDDFICIRDRDV